MDGGLTRWQSFVLRHTKPGNLILHAISAACFFGAPVVAMLTTNPWWLLPFFVSGLIGSAGHRLFDDGGVNLRETTSAPEVPGYVLIMFWMLARGQWWDEVARARQAMPATPASQPTTPPQ